MIRTAGVLAGNGGRPQSAPSVLRDVMPARAPAVRAMMRCSPRAHRCRPTHAGPAMRLWSLIYTSGTTGAPKGVIQTYQMAAVNAFHVTQAFGVRAGDVTLNFLPLFHTAGIQLVTLPTLIAGGTVIVLPAFDAQRALALMPRLDVFFGVPAVYQQMALASRASRAPTSRACAPGAAAARRCRTCWSNATRPRACACATATA